MVKILMRVFLLMVLPTSFLFSCPIECLLNVAECNLLRLRSTISAKRYDEHVRVIEKKTAKAEKQLLNKLSLQIPDENMQQETLVALKNKADLQVRKDLVYIIAIVMGRLPKLFLKDDPKMPGRIENVAKLYPKALYVEVLLGELHRS